MIVSQKNEITGKIKSNILNKNIVNLIMDNVFLEIRYASNDIEFKIWDTLSFTIRDFNPNTPPVTRHLFNRKTKKTYTGLLPYVEEILNDNHIEYTLIDKRIAWEENADFSLVKYLDEAETIELKARDYQQNIIDTCNPREIIQAPTSSGKALPLNTNILTPNGWKKMQDIRIGDIVYDEDGKETKVIGEYLQGLKDVYEITFQDNTKIKCCKDHLWEYTTLTFQFDTNKYRIATTEQLLKYGIYNLYREHKTYKIAIPVNKSIDFKNKNLKVPPYLLGILLGDGFFSEPLLFTNYEDDIIDKVNQLIINNNLGKFVKDQNHSSRYYYQYNDNILNLQQYIQNIFGKKCPTSKKFIPHEYLFSSIEDRLELARGLIDADGIITNGHIRFCTASKQLADDFIFLIRSLGYRTTSRYINKTKAYIVTIHSDNNLLFTSNKHKQKYNNRHISIKKYRYNILKIVDIKKLNYQEEMKCIAVDSPKHTYICENFIVTHNTFIMAGLIAKFNVKPVSIFADKISLCMQLKTEFEKFLGQPIGLVGGGIKDIKDITVYSVQSTTEEMVKDTKMLMVDECLTYNTKIQLTSGKVIEIGKLVEERNNKQYKVLSYNIQENKIEFKRILNFYKISIVNKKLLLILIKVENKMYRIICTDDHRFFVKNLNMYIKADELLENYELIINDTNNIYIGKLFKKVQYIHTEKFVYDIEVEDNHNFFANNILVHNCHHQACDTFSQISRWCKDAYYRVGVSATPWRDDGSDLLIDACFTKKDPNKAISASLLIEKNYLTPCTIYWVNQLQTYKGKNYNTLYRDAIIMNNDRNKNIVNIAAQLRKAKDATILILIQRIEHGEILLHMLKEYIPCKSFFMEVLNKVNKKTLVRLNEIEMISGEDPQTKREAILQALREKKVHVVLGTTVFDEGISVDSIDTIILAGAGRSSTRAYQRIGRGLRLYPGKEKCIIIDFWDKTDIFLRQARARNKMYKAEEAFDIQMFPTQLLNKMPPKIH